MYIPAKFNETRPALLHGLIHQYPLGTVITHGAGGLDANHIPFLIDAPAPDAPCGVLRAHVARNNALWRQDGSQTLVVFQGPSAYITPAFYEEKAVSGKVVPTYHYAVVHAHGKLRTVEDPQWLLALLKELTAKHEAPQPMPWAVEDAPPEYIERLMKAIVGIEIRIERIEGKFKVGQDDLMAEQQRMEQTLGEPMAAVMRERREG